MDNKQDIEQPISREKAFMLLFNTKETDRSNQNCFDKFGNYVFPTDMVVNTPNTATGTSSGLSFLNGICVLQLTKEDQIN